MTTLHSKSIYLVLTWITNKTRNAKHSKSYNQKTMCPNVGVLE